MTSILMKKVKFCLLLVAIIYNAICYSQNQQVQLAPTIIPPSPTVSELGKYGLIPVGMSSGTFNLDIPLYAFKTKNLTLPVSLSYNGSAIKVDEVSSWVGMHWSLNAGGVVSRIVRDDADNLSNIPYPENFNSSPDGLSYIEKAGRFPQDLDTEPDLFTFNFLGYSGKFIFDRNGEVVSMPRNDLRIEIFSVSGLRQFVITTPTGVKCTFDALETSTMTVSYDESFSPAVTAWYLTKIEHPQGDVIKLSYEISRYTYYVGQSQSLARVTQRNFVHYVDSETGPAQIAVCPVENLSSSISGIYLDGLHLKKIESVGFGSIEFISTSNRSDLADYKLDELAVKDAEGHLVKGISLSYIFSNNSGFLNSNNTLYDELKHRMFLTGIIEKDNLLNSVKKHLFEYDDINGLPARLSYAQDHWGYFNGASNNNFLPNNFEERDYTGGFAFAGRGGDREPNDLFARKGMLSKVTYPTGGSSNFTYGANTYYGEKTVVPALAPVALFCNGHESPLPVTKSFTFTSQSDQVIYYSAYSSFLSGYTTTQAGAQLLVNDTQAGLLVSEDLVIGQTYSGYIQLLKNHQYTFSLIAKNQDDGPIENNTTSTLYFEYYATAPQVSLDNIKTGGLRVEKITNYDPFTGKNESVNYYYASYDQPSKSSGQIGGQPIYVTKYTTKTSYGPTLQRIILVCPYVALHSNSVNSVFSMNGNFINYSFVTVSRGDSMQAGVEEHEFNVRFDNQGTLMWGTDFIKDSPLSNTGWDNNQEKNVRYFSMRNGNFVLLKHINNSYVKDSRYSKSIPGLVVRKKFEPINPRDVVYNCDASNISLVYNRYYSCTTIHRHWWYLGFFAGTKCIARGNNNQWVTYGVHPCYGKTVGAVATASYELDYLDAVEYRNISDWVYLDKKTETVYDENGLNPLVTETQYYYDNDAHIQLSRIITTTSEGKQNQISMKYPPDFDPSANAIVNSLLNNNIISLPIKNETTRGGNQIDGEFIEYNVKGQPTNIYKYESQILKIPTAHDATQFIPSLDYNLKSSIDYDPLTSNVTKVQLTNNFGTIYLWGYNNTLPIAEIKNADSAAAWANYSATNVVTADVLASSWETSLTPTFEIFSTQSINPSSQVTVVGNNPPSTPMLTLRLRKLDGTVITDYTSNWGLNNLGTISIEPGVYQWYYYTDDITFGSGFNGINFTVTTNYIGRRNTSKVYHTSFEENGILSSFAHTGSKIWTGQYVVNISGLNGNYKLTYWKKTGTTHWTLNEQLITITLGTAQSITIGATGSDLDEVRLFPEDAQMTTYTYKHLLGITSSTDYNNVSTYFEYDTFGRVKLIKDQVGNILKSYSYHYKGQ